MKMIKIKNKYVEILVLILFSIVLMIKFRFVYLNPLYWLTNKYYSKRVKIIGKENIPDKDGYVIISNHNFVSEYLIVKKIFKKKIFVVVANSLIFKFMDTSDIIIPYDKNKKNIKKSGKNKKKIILEKCKNEKKNVLVFPEGNWTNVNNMYLFKKGLFYLCYQNQIPIVPILFLIKKEKNNTYRICLDNKIKIKIFEKVNPSNFNNFDEYYYFIYNQMNDYLKKYINKPNIKYSILF